MLARMDPPARLFTVEGAEHLFTGRAPDAAAGTVEAVESVLQSFRARPS